MADPQWVHKPLKLWDEYPITGPFGATSPDPPWSPGHPHMGLDIGVPEGYWLYAPADGRVVEFANDGSFGLGVCIDVPGTPYYSLYAHMSRVDVQPGDVVTAGQRVGLTGATSNVPLAPHLHWQVCTSRDFPRDLARNVDPLRFRAWDTASPSAPTIEEMVRELWRRTGGDAGRDYDLLASMANLQRSLGAFLDGEKEEALRLLQRLEGIG